MTKKMTRDQILMEIRNKCNKIYVDNNFKSRVRIANNNITLDCPDQKELELVFKILSDILKDYGVNPQTGELIK